MNGVLNTRERFLHDAAASLLGSSPSSAEHLRRNFVSIRALKNGARQLDSRNFCTACGSFRVDFKEIEVKSRRKRSSRVCSTSTTEAEVQKLQIGKCRRCSRSVKQAVRAAAANPSKDIAEVQVERDQSLTADAASPRPQLPHAKASSKKRTKERRDREGLKAMMSKSKDKSNNASRFSLMDFMSSGGA